MRFLLSLRSPFRELEVGYSGSEVPFGVMYILPPPRITLKEHQREMESLLMYNKTILKNFTALFFTKLLIYFILLTYHVQMIIIQHCR